MKSIAPFSLLICAFLSWPAFADKQDSANAKYASMHEKCKAMGERHRLSGDRMDAWMERCMTMAKLPKDDVANKGMSMDDMDHMGEMRNQKSKKK
jgi:hypothetical protein